MTSSLFEIFYMPVDRAYVVSYSSVIAIWALKWFQTSVKCKLKYAMYKNTDDVIDFINFQCADRYSISSMEI